MSTVHVALAPDGAQLLREAQEWRLLELLFQRPRAQWREEVAELAQDCADPTLNEAGASAQDADEGEYLAFFGPGGIVSPRDPGYRRPSAPAQALSEISAFHAAFAFQPAVEDPIDHVSVMCGFVGWLRLKQAFALSIGDLESADVTREAAQRFVRTHLTPCAEPLALRLTELEAGHLALAASALLARTGPRPKDVEGDWVPSGLGVEDCSLTCGLAGHSGGDAEGSEELPPEFTAGLPRSK